MRKWLGDHTGRKGKVIRSHKRSQTRLMAAVGSGMSLPAGRAEWLRWSTTRLATPHAMVGRSRGSGKFGDSVCDAPYQQMGAQIALNCGDNGGVSWVWLRS